MALPAGPSRDSTEKGQEAAEQLPPMLGNMVGCPAAEALGGENVELSLTPSLQRMPDSLKRIYLTANGSSRLSCSNAGGSCAASLRSAEDSAAGLGAGADGTGSRKEAASCGASWRSAEDSAAALDASGKGPSGAADRDAAGSSNGGGSSLSLYDELDADDIWGGGGSYGADARRPFWRRHEGLAGCWLLLALLAAAAINLGVGVANSRRAAARLPAAGGAAAEPPEVASPALQPGPRSTEVPAPGAALPQLAPRPPPPPPAYCEPGGGAPANLARSRFSNLTAMFPAQPSQHYAANLVDRKAGNALTRYPAYYNGVVPRFCILVVEAIYTCLREDNPCNYSPEVSLRLCETACPASADSCRGVAGMAGHPLQTRSCGLFGLSKPSCINIGFAAGRQRMMRAYYKLNVCQAPPGLPPPPRPPLAPP